MGGAEGPGGCLQGIWGGGLGLNICFSGAEIPTKNGFTKTPPLSFSVRFSVRRMVLVKRLVVRKVFFFVFLL